jgi:hypothetical protein
MQLEITTEGGHVVIEVNGIGTSYSRYFWPESIRRHISRWLPHARVEIERVIVSERTPPE